MQGLISIGYVAHPFWSGGDHVHHGTLQ